MDVCVACPDCGFNLELDVASNPPGTQVDCPRCPSRILVPPPDIGPGVTIGGFQLRRLLGRGGMGEVYLATDESVPRDVALKILPAAFAVEKAAVRCFRREVENAARLKHPNIVRAYEAGEDQGVHYLAMEYVEGETLDERLREEGPISEREAVAIALKLGSALKQIWDEHRMVHHDLKPANIMLDEHGEPRLMDMGLSLAPGEEDLGASSAFVGSPNFMSPEQISAGNDLDFRTDIYSLGATLYLLLTAEAPFPGQTFMEVLRLQATESLRDPRYINPRISEGLVQVIERMMAKRREDRFQSWTALLADLARVSEGALPTHPTLASGHSVMIRSDEIVSGGESNGADQGAV